MDMKVAAAGVAVVLLVASCSSKPATEGPSAVARLQPTTGNTASGTVTFVQRGETLRVTADVSGLTPNAEHGFHVHEKGDCSSGDGMSAGGHFNPDAKPHGAPNKPHHDGDLWALKADANGAAKSTFTVEGVTVSAGTHSVVGRGLIVHKDPDDYTTQPTGNSGARIACAVIAGVN